MRKFDKLWLVLLRCLVFIAIILIVGQVVYSDDNYNWETRSYEVRKIKISDGEKEEKIVTEYYVYWGNAESKEYEQYLASMMFDFRYMVIKEDGVWKGYIFHSHHGISPTFDPFEDEVWAATPETMRKTIELLKEEEKVILISLNLITRTMNVWLHPRFERNKVMYNYYTKKLNRLELEMPIRKTGKIASI